MRILSGTVLFSLRINNVQGYQYNIVSTIYWPQNKWMSSLDCPDTILQQNMTVRRGHKTHATKTFSQFFVATWIN